MSRNDVKRAVGGMALCVLLAVSAAAAGEREAGRFHEVQTDHYRVYTDLSERFTHLVGQHMEEIYREYERRFEGYDLKEHDRFRVRVFKRQSDYEDATPAELKGSVGSFISSRRLLAAYMGDHTEERVFKTLYHEGFHQFLWSAVGAKVPLWVNEGFAEYFSEAVWNGRRFSMGRVSGGRVEVIREALGNRQHIPLQELFRMENDGWLANVRGGDARLQYAQAWSVVHFLCHAGEGRHRRRLLGYIKMLADGTGRQKAFRSSFGTDMEGFEGAWSRYVSGLQPGPEEQCRSNMKVLLFMGRQIFDGPPNFTSLKKLRRAMLSDSHRWHVTLGNGEKIRSSEKRRIVALFKCPLDRGRRESSYILLRNPETRLPELYCVHHSGNVIRAYFRGSGGGEYQERAQRVVSATLPHEVLRALKRRMR